MWFGRLFRPVFCPGGRVDVPDELGLDHDVVADGPEGLADDPFRPQRPLRLGRFEECHPLIDCCPDGGGHVLAG
jgi:hypothetical protein